MTMMPPSTVVDLFARFCWWMDPVQLGSGCAASWREIAMQSLKLASRGSGHLGSFGDPDAWDLHVYIILYIVSRNMCTYCV